MGRRGGAGAGAVAATAACREGKAEAWLATSAAVCSTHVVVQYPSLSAAACRHSPTWPASTAAAARYCPWQQQPRKGLAPGLLLQAPQRCHLAAPTVSGLQRHGAGDRAHRKHCAWRARTLLQHALNPTAGSWQRACALHAGRHQPYQPRLARPHLWPCCSSKLPPTRGPCPRSSRAAAAAGGMGRQLDAGSFALACRGAQDVGGP